jgi:spore germination protein YaaH
MTQLAAVLLLAGCAPFHIESTYDTTASAPEGGRTVLVYNVDYAKQPETDLDIQAHRSDIDIVSDFSYRVRADGTVAGSALRHTGLDTYVCVANLNNGQFDPKTIGKILKDPKLSRKLQDNLIQLAISNGYKGINLDFEQLDSSDEAAYVRFLQELHEKTSQKGITLSVAIAPSIGNDDFHKGVGQNADQVVLMTYDYSYPGGKPGAVAPTWWVKSVLDYETTVIPRQKILLGINAYGYAWANSRGAAVALKNIEKVKEKYHATDHFDGLADAPFLTYTKEHKDYILYYEDYHSLTDKMNLVKEYGLQGIAIWRVGLENEDLWRAVEQFRQR